MNALRNDLNLYEVLDDITVRYGLFAILRALVAHRIGRRRRSALIRPVDLPAHLRRDIGLAEPIVDRPRAMDVVNYR